MSEHLPNVGGAGASSDGRPILREVGLNEGADDVREKAAEEAVEAGGKLEGPLSIRSIRACLLGDPHDEINVGPKNSNEGSVGDGGGMEGLPEKMRG